MEHGAADDFAEAEGWKVLDSSDLKGLVSIVHSLIVHPPLRTISRPSGPMPIFDNFIEYSGNPFLCAEFEAFGSRMKHFE